jgi:hypothetical protein
MGLFDNIFGGGNREKTRDESSVQADINRGLKESGGKFTPEINSLVAERERARSGGASSGGLGSLSAGLGRAVDTVRSIPGNFARDVRMGTSANVFANRDKQAENLANRVFRKEKFKITLLALTPLSPAMQHKKLQGRTKGQVTQKWLRFVWALKTFRPKIKCQDIATHLEQCPVLRVRCPDLQMH